jgi:hypothetical protein
MMIDNYEGWPYLKSVPTTVSNSTISTYIDPVPIPNAIWHEGQAIFVGEGNEDRYCKEWGAKRIYLGERR